MRTFPLMTRRLKAVQFESESSRRSFDIFVALPEESYDGRNNDLYNNSFTEHSGGDFVCVMGRNQTAQIDLDRMELLGHQMNTLGAIPLFYHDGGGFCGAAVSTNAPLSAVKNIKIQLRRLFSDVQIALSIRNKA